MSPLIRGGRALRANISLRLALSGLVGASAVRAQPPAPAEPGGFDSQVRGAIADVGIGTSHAGDHSLLELGAAWQGMESLGTRRWLLQWDLLAGVRAGYLANEHPYLFLLGGELGGFAEAGYRFPARSEVSPYLGLRLAEQVQILAHPGRALADLDRHNDVDGLGGTLVQGAFRAAGGASSLTPALSWLVVGFVEEAYRAREVNAEALLLSQFGLAARIDRARGWSASLEAAWGIGPARRYGWLAASDR
ncbi:MAG TPA: hypothetical protein VG963_08500, partial [Polyangiaceae bacterium]|nr:hypothetical protein [Polyangiaceae bacterium]